MQGSYADGTQTILTVALRHLFCHSVKMQRHKVMRIFVDGTIVHFRRWNARFSFETGKKRFSFLFKPSTKFGRLKPNKKILHLLAPSKVLTPS